MDPRATYAAVAESRASEMGVRLLIAVYITVATLIMTADAKAYLWLGLVGLYQFVDLYISRRVEAVGLAEPSRGLKLAYIFSVFMASATFSAISPVLWLQGGEPARWFAIMLSCGGMLHISLRAYPSRAVMIAGVLPHGLSLFGMYLVYGLGVYEGPPIGILLVIIGAGFYVGHLAAGARQSGTAMRELHAASVESDTARESAERANAAKSQFLATITHEIRTPMNAVLSAAHLLRRTDLTAEQAEHVSMLVNGGEVLMGLLNDVLDISKIEAGKMELDETTVDLPELLQGLIQLYRPRTDERGVVLTGAFDGDLPARITTDALRLRQILFNLLSNAVKFTDSGRIVLTANVSTDRKMLIFEVADTGPGIDDDTMARLFGSFEQARASARTHGGTGLGLSIARKLAELMGGSLACRSTLGEGTVFRLELPLVEAAADSADQDAGDRREAPLRPLSILVAEDHEVNRRIVSLFLEPLGWRLTMAHDGREAVERAAVERFDAILMDMQMPVMGGVDAGLAIRAGGGPNADAPIIALTANAMGHHRDEWGEVRVAAFLTKPIDPDLLVATLLRAAREPLEEGLREVA